MEKTNLHYSTKNIPTASRHHYKMQLVDKIEAVIKRMRWKAIFFDNDNGDEQEEEQSFETYGLKTTITPKQVPELIEFEKELISMVPDLKFKRFTNNFQQQLRKDINSMKSSNKLYVPADKTTNMYKVTPQEYDRLLTNSITKTYKKTNNNTKHLINDEGKKIMKDQYIASRMTINAENNCFITLKDHKENFINNPTTRLINPAKNELGRISKVIIANINSQLRSKLQLNQWGNTASVIEWFKNIYQKSIYKFMVFDVKDFYPSITEKLLKNSIAFAERSIPIKRDEKEIVFHARKSLLFNKSESWIKKGNKLFDVTMGAYDGAEICELVGCYILSILASKYRKEDIGIYRDDGLAVFKNTSGPQSERIKKDFQKIFKKHDLDIVIQCNMKVVNYLDVTLNLNTGNYSPYRKPDNEINYVNVNSNHPRNIIKQIPISIQNRLSNLSANEEIFEAAIPYYKAALERSGYNHEFKYTPSNPQQRRKNRKRKIIWFNPPYNNNLSTNVGKKFLNLIKKHFPKKHKFHKIFNKNNVKVSYSCMPNVKANINAHNKSLLAIHTQVDENQEQERMCNCTDQESCPFSNNCLDKSLVYEATVNTNLPGYQETKYIGLTEPTFKKRHSGHKTSFNHQRYQHQTTLSTEVWRIKQLNGTPTITWRKIKNAKAFTPESNKCLLCLNEKLEIANYPGDNLLNKRNEIISKCRHRMKFELLRHKSDIT